MLGLAMLDRLPSEMPVRDPIAGNSDSGLPQIYHPSLGVYSDVSIRMLPDGADDQVAETISVMRQYALEDAGCPEILQACRDAIAESNNAHPIPSVWNYVRSRMTFVYDRDWGSPVEQATGVPVIEVVTHPRDMHTWWQGDCDDYMTFATCMLITCGVPMAFATVAADERVPDEYTHVYLVAYPVDEETGQTQRVPLDFSHGKEIGWETANRFGKFREWPVSGAGVSRTKGESLFGLCAGVVGFWLACGGGRRATA